ncbi:MAG: terpene cyclase/mutase family protein, partial [Planctomycetes bacterium]|nr:terpene cyclase/mutase family protein [Planctomycetota bacterium]
GPSAEKIEVPPAQRRDIEPTAPDSPAAAKRLIGDSPPAPKRGSLEDVPATLLQRFATLPPPTEGDDLGLLSSVPAGSPNNTPPRPLREVMGTGTGSAAGEDSAYAGETFATDGGRSPRGNLVSAGPGASKVGLTGIPRTDADGPKTLPDVYRLRVAPNRTDVTRGNGGTAETEAAVKAALKWLADNQDADGRWNPRSHGGGMETKVLGRDRQGAGSHADTAVSGLALLAFLASGNTHLDGPYSEDVRRGLEYLLRTQAPDGNLGGQAAAFEFMYSHAMAACALSEAYGMTRDARLREPVRRAVAYTIAAQDPTGGGWRYRPGDPGDTSQLGWQLMTLKSAELAGIPIPEKTRRGIIRYLQSVSSGQYGGRASYRPGESPSRPMTAEALVCWQFLGLRRQHPAGNEAGDYLLEETPGEGDYNLYYWYYATLGMYQLQGAHWQRWNDAMRNAVVDRQVKEGPLAGSWDTNALWGGYGGRVYTTALATLTLEVYYRFLPLFAEVAHGDDRTN